MKFAMIDGPLYGDCCEHGQDTYVSSFLIHESDGKTGYDLYVYTNHFKQDVCLRYGDEPHEYFSVGQLNHLMTQMADEVMITSYRVALSILARYGTFGWDKGGQA